MLGIELPRTTETHAVRFGGGSARAGSSSNQAALKLGDAWQTPFTPGTKYAASAELSCSIQEVDVAVKRHRSIGDGDVYVARVDLSRALKLKACRTNNEAPLARHRPLTCS